MPGNGAACAAQRRHRDSAAAHVTTSYVQACLAMARPARPARRSAATATALLVLALLVAAPAAASSATVATGGELLAALTAGTEHILITEHLDLRDLPPMDISTDGPVQLLVSPTTRSISVRVLSRFEQFAHAADATGQLRTGSAAVLCPLASESR